MTQPSTRKQFFAKLLGVTTAANVLPKSLSRMPAMSELGALTMVSQQRFQVQYDLQASAGCTASL